MPVDNAPVAVTIAATNWWIRCNPLFRSISASSKGRRHPTVRASRMARGCHGNVRQPLSLHRLSHQILRLSELGIELFVNCPKLFYGRLEALMRRSQHRQSLLRLLIQRSNLIIRLRLALVGLAQAAFLTIQTFLKPPEVFISTLYLFQRTSPRP